jgi:hypothetical protein
LQGEGASEKGALDAGGSVIASAASALIELDIRRVYLGRGAVELVPQLARKVFDKQISACRVKDVCLDRPGLFGRRFDSSLVCP